MEEYRAKRKMKKLFEIKPADSEFYDTKIKDFLPEKIIDIHTHIWKEEKSGITRLQKRGPTWPSLAAKTNPAEHLIQTYKLLLPGKNVTPLIFNSPAIDGDTDKLNNYVTRAAKKHSLPSLMLSRPEWTEDEFEKKMLCGGFSGAKPYLSFAPEYLPSNEIRVFDFMPPSQLEILNRHGLILMLHIPRPGRLKDPVNLAQILEIEKTFPRLKLIIAHAGRAYCPTDAGDAFNTLKKTKNMMFDISANTNAAVFHKLIQTFGPGKILFGSDLPITSMRMKRVCRGGMYVNIVPEGLYGDVSGDRHMEEAGAADAAKLTFFLYEEIYAFRKAAIKSGLNSKDIEDVFCNNAEKLFKDSKTAAGKEQLMMELPENELRKYTAGPALPEGYAIRTYRKNDETKYLKLMRNAGFEGWSNLESCMKSALPGGTFFITHKESGAFAGTCSAWHNPSETHPSGGELSWLAVDPRHRGLRIGETLCKAVISRFREAGYTDIYLKTDDFRLAAIKTYLKLGFIPVYSSAGMKGRWKKIYKDLNAHMKELK